MPRYIDADALKADLRESEIKLREIYEGLKFDDERRICGAEITTFVECILRVKDAPTADVAEVKHGGWDASGRYKFADGSLAIRCTECGCALRESDWEQYHWNYCPVCGAKMDGKGDYE